MYVGSNSNFLLNLIRFHFFFLLGLSNIIIENEKIYKLSDLMQIAIN